MDKHNKAGSLGITHPFDPVFDAQSKVLVLGSFPSVQSRENAFYYGHPQNRFWPLIAALFSQRTPETVAQKTTLLLSHSIALWDVVAACTITGSADSTLSPLKFNDVPALLRTTKIRTVFANGQKAGKLYQKHLEPETGIPACLLPSTSPANAVWTMHKLHNAWQPLVDAVNDTAVP